MSDKLKCSCPACGKDAKFTIDCYGDCYYYCSDCGMSSIRKPWQELIRTRKALKIAVDVLKELKPQKAKGGGYWAVKSTDAIKLINTALEQITALEQKD